jgi:hypothetical protein
MLNAHITSYLKYVQSYCYLLVAFRVQISSDNTLTISDVQREDAGSYKCSAANFVGRITSVAYVKVNGKLTVCKHSILTVIRVLFVTMLCIT